jgi:argininosuccinate lyase
VKTWQGRFDSSTSSVFERFTSSVIQDQILAPYDIQVSQAHAQALERIGLITKDEAQRINVALSEIGEQIGAGEFEWRDELEDVHTHIEARLRQNVGDLANKLHAGRSRNDQIAADLRLYVLDQTRTALATLLDLQDVLLLLAAKHSRSLMPGYSHLQQAQPVVIAFPLLAHVAMLGRDWERFRDSLARASQSPLGSGAVAGSTFPIERQALAQAAGLGVPIENSLDAVSDRDFIVEFIFASALCMAHLSRLAEDLIIWSSTEFGFVRLPDAFASGSSMMPQKKNPDVPELIRGRSALVIGDLTAILTLVKGIPLGYDRDLQEDKTPLFHAATTTLAALEVLTAMMPELVFDTERCATAISSFAMATDLADHLVRNGVPFRDAHAAVGTLVSDRIRNGKPLSPVTDEAMTAAGLDGIAPPDLSPDASVTQKATAGSTNPTDVESQIEVARDKVTERRTWLRDHI